MGKNISGFTLIEMISVTVVIGILATITLVGYNGVRTRAQVSSVSDGLTKVRDAMWLWAQDQRFATWPVDPVGGGGTPFSTMIQSNPVLRQYIQKVPSVEGVQTEEWFYDNDGDTRTDCGDAYAGVNIVLRYVTNQSIAQGVDNALDDGNLNCGKVRYVDQRLFYGLSNDQKIRN